MVHFLVCLIRGSVLWQHGEGLAPSQSRPLPWREHRRLAPGGEKMQTLLALANGPSILRVHIQAGSAAIDLGCSNFHKLEEFALKRRTSNHALEFRQRP